MARREPDIFTFDIGKMAATNGIHTLTILQPYPINVCQI